MEEKDQQIVHLQQQVKEMDTKIDAKLETQAKDLNTKLQQQTRDLDTKLQQQTKDLDTKLQEQTKDLDTKLQEQTRDLDTKFVQVQCKLEDLTLIGGYTYHDFTLTEFKKQQAKRETGDWYSDPFYNHPGGYRIQLGICTNGYGKALGTHLTAHLHVPTGSNDDNLKWPIKCIVYLQMLNQRGDHGHHTVIGTHTHTKGLGILLIGSTDKFFPLDKLGYCGGQNTEYLKNDCLKFRMYLKVEST